MDSMTIDASIKQAVEKEADLVERFETNNGIMMSIEQFLTGYKLGWQQALDSRAGQQEATA